MLTHDARKSSSGGASSVPYQRGWVSVIIPTHNRGEFLGEAIRSAWEQDYRPIEVLVVDDGSTDDTERVIRVWIERTAEDLAFRLRYVRFMRAHGAAFARNRGLALCRGEFVQFLDSDDYMSPARFRIIIEKVRHTRRFAVACTAYNHVSVVGKTFACSPPLDLTSPHRIALAIRGVLWTGSPLYHRSFLNRIGPWREDLAVREDREFGVRVAQACEADECVIVADSLVSYRHHEAPRLSRTVAIVQCQRHRMRFVSRVRRNIRDCAWIRKHQLELVRVLLTHVHAGWPYGRRYIRYTLGLCPVGVTRIKVCALLSWHRHGYLLAALLWPIFHAKIRWGAWSRAERLRRT